MTHTFAPLSQTKNRLASLAAALFLVFALAGCCGGGEHFGAFPFPRMAPMAPPDPIVEEKVVAEDPTVEIWRPGFWNYDGFEFSWVSGTMMPRPDPSAVWMADRWELRDFGWAFVPGYWQ